MKQYHDLVRTVLAEGEETLDRTGVGTIGILGHMMRFNLNAGFPLVTTKRLSFKSIAVELLWFLRGDTNIKYLLERGVTIWNEWPFKRWVESADYTGPDMTDFGRRALEDPEFAQVYDRVMKEYEQRVLTDDAFSQQYGDIGPGYGKQWRAWPVNDTESIDQITNVINQIKKSPYSRRILVNAWNVAEVHKMALPPCHCMFQFKVFPSGKVSCMLTQRSVDVGLGAPYNIASYALLTRMIGHVTGLSPGDFVHSMGDTHIYLNHVDPLNDQLTREPHPLPTLRINPAVTDIFGFQYDNMNTCCKQYKDRFECPECGSRRDFILDGYKPHPPIKMEIAV